MSDPARQGSVLQQGGLQEEERPDGAERGALPGWQGFARTHDWRRAVAAASLSQADPALQAALEAVGALQEDVRARRYPAARRALGSYRDLLSSLEGQAAGDAALLHALAAPPVLDAALSALESASGEADPAVLQEKLAAAQAHPLTQAEAANVLGVLHALREEQAAARTCFEQAVALDGGHYRARMNLGNLALESGDAAGAEVLYREVLQLAPEYDGAHHNLGVALRRQGKVYESVGSIRRAQRLNVKRARDDARDDAREQLRTDPRLRLIRNVVLAVMVIVLLLIFLPGRG